MAVAIRQEALWGPAEDADVYMFPIAAVRARNARRQQVVFMRRRLAVAALLVGVVTLVLAVGGVGNSAPTSAPGAPRHVTLKAGGTLWDLAERFAPVGSDPRAYVDALIELNELEGAPRSGARLKLPR